MPSQRWLHIIPVSFIMYTIAFIDRTNVSLALPFMSRDLHMNATQAGGAAGVFFWGYVVLQIPGGHLAQHWSAKKFVSILLMVWGLCSICCGLVRTYHEFWIMRLLLGVAEGGVWPAVLVLLSNWFPRSERARANAYWMLCLPVAVIVSSPLSGWILSHWNWRVLLIVEGALPFVWLVVWWICIDDYPKQASWISQEERTYLETTLQQESRHLEQVEPEPFWRALCKPVVLVMIVVYLMQNTGNYGYLFWLPSAITSAKKVSSLLVGFLFTVPYFVSAIAMVLISRHSDKKHERRGHVAFGLMWSSTCMLAGLILTVYAPKLSFMAISLVVAGAYGTLGPFWAIPTETLPRSISGSAIGLINALGNLGGYFGPLIVGYMYNRTGDFRYAFAALFLAYITGAITTRLLPTRPIAAES
jgi:MFS family permease